MARPDPAPLGLSLEEPLDPSERSWRAFQPSTGQQVVLRYLDPQHRSAHLNVRLQRLNELDLPRAVTPLDLQLLEEPRYLVFPYFPVSLTHAAEMRHSATQVEPWLRQIAQTLELAHAQGLYHGALRAGNLLMDRQSELRIDGWLTAPEEASELADVKALGRLGQNLLAGASAPALLDLLSRTASGQFTSAGQFLEALGKAPSSRLESALWKLGAVVLLGGLLFDFRVLALGALGALVGAVAGMWMGRIGWRGRG